MIKRITNLWHNTPLGAKISIAYTICSILQKSVSFITLPLFTRLLTTEQYGEINVYQSWFGILSIFLTLNVAYGSFGKAMIKYEDDRDGYISSIEGICLFLSLVFLIIYLPFQSLWNKLFELPTSLMLLMVLDIICSTATSLWSGK